MKNKLFWWHKKFGSTRRYLSEYRFVRGERLMLLVAKLRTGREDKIVVNSWQAAKKAGWKRSYGKVRI